MRTLISHPTPPQHTVNIASCCIIKVVPVGGTCVDNVVYIKDVVVRTFISHPTPFHPTPYIYIYTKRKNVPKRTGHPSRREQLLNHRPITIITRQSVQRLHKAHGHQQSSANATATGLLSECHGVDVRTGAEEGHSKSISLKGPAN